MITSKDNPTLKSAATLLTKKGRDLQNRFLIEGQKLVQEALRHPGLVELILVDESISETWTVDKEEYSGPVYVLAPRLGKVLSDTETPQGIWAICHKPDQEDLAKVIQESNLILYLTGIQDPGNLGTMLRTAWSVGVGAVFLTPGTVDLYNPKVIRSAMGAAFALPVYEKADAAYVERIKQAGYKVLACTARGETSLFESRLKGKVAFMIGSEGKGIPKEYEDLADIGVNIPLQPGVESLNAAVACGIVLYEAYRQKNLSIE